MIETFEIMDAVTLRCMDDRRFKQGCLSIQLVRSMCREEASLNALLSAVLLRGCRDYPDLQAITWRLDELYGGSVGTLVRRVGDYQTTGFYCGFMEDRFCMDGDRVLAPMLELVRQLLLEPVLEDGAFCRDYVEGEKRNLISTIESQLNNKRAYAASRLIHHMCREDSFGIQRLGQIEDVQAITPETLYAHYRRILRQSRIDLFYVGSCPGQRVAQMVGKMLAGLERDPVSLPKQTSFHDAGGCDLEETMDIAQGNLCMGFVTPTTLRDRDFVAMQMLNVVFGSGMTSKLFQRVREELSLCYAIGSGYHGTKGILTVSAGIDSGNKELVKQEILNQLEQCRRGNISAGELNSARQALLSSLQSIHDAPGSIENYYASAALSGMKLTPKAYMEAVKTVTAEDLAAAAKTLRLHSIFFLKGVAAC